MNTHVIAIIDASPEKFLGYFLRDDEAPVASKTEALSFSEETATREALIVAGTWVGVTTKVVPIASRIPAFTTPTEWATKMNELGLTYHYEEDPRDILLGDNQPMFTMLECAEIEEIFTYLTDDQIDELVSLGADFVHEALMAALKNSRK
jgi:hypothetical protein